MRYIIPDSTSGGNIFPIPAVEGSFDFARPRARDKKQIPFWSFQLPYFKCLGLVQPFNPTTIKDLPLSVGNLYRF